jgi:histidine phosphotransfer protein HptB
MGERGYRKERKIKMITTHNTSADEDNTALIFDPSHLLKELGEEWELLEEILVVFQESTASDLESLRGAIASGNSDQAIRWSHKIKGAAANINAEGVRKAACDIETAVRAGNTQEANVLLENLFQEFDTLTQLLRDRT